MILYHATTPKKLARYQSSGRIILPVRGWTTLAAAEEWARRVGRSIVLEVEGRDCHKLPDHRNRYGTGWWIDHDVTEWRCVVGEGAACHRCGYRYELDALGKHGCPNCCG